MLTREEALKLSEENETVEYKEKLLSVSMAIQNAAGMGKTKTSVSGSLGHSDAGRKVLAKLQELGYDTSIDGYMNQVIDWSKKEETQ